MSDTKIEVTDNNLLPAVKVSGIPFLKVKIKSLAEEARIIRKEEKREANKYHKRELRDHRIGTVRDEARAAQLAYAFLRGKPYYTLEAKVHSEPNWKRVKDLVVKYLVCVSSLYARVAESNKDYCLVSSEHYTWIRSEARVASVVKELEVWKTKKPEVQSSASDRAPTSGSGDPPKS